MIATAKTGRADYTSRRSSRLDKLTDRAESLAVSAESTIVSARQMGAGIPLGQPIHAGHSSEKADRSLRARIESRFRKGFDLLKSAKDADVRARAALANTAISSDDPDAIEALRVRIAEAESELAILALARDILAKLPVKEHVDALKAIEIPIALLKQSMVTKPFADRKEIPAFVFANRRGNLKRLRDRVESLELQAARETRPTLTIGDVTITDNREENRIQLDAGGRVCGEAYDYLKANGFKRTREGLWQRMPGGEVDRVIRIACQAAKIELASNASASGEGSVST